jgi:hypothetical protein
LFLKCALRAAAGSDKCGLNALVGAAEGCDLLILFFKAKAKIAAFGSSYTGAIECRVRRLEFLEGRNAKTRFRGFLGNSRS